MEMSSTRWLSELGMEDPTSTHEYKISSFDEFMTQEIAAAFGEDFQHSFSSESFNSYPITTTTTTNFSCSSMEGSQTTAERPAKLLKTESRRNSFTTQNISTSEAPNSPMILSFGNSISPSNSEQFYSNLVFPVKPEDELKSSSENLISEASSYKNQNFTTKSSQGTKRKSPMTKPPSHTLDHVIAERNRREKLSQRFIALSAIVPGLKKMDKGSVLGDAVKYLKTLQERVKILEEQTKKKPMESVIFVKKSKLSVDDGDSSFDENSDEPLPEIEARVSDKNILIRIHCEKSKGVLVKTLAEIEKLHLTVVNSSAIPFGNSVIDITIVAQMDVEFTMTLKDLVRKLRSTFSQFM